MDIKNRTLRDLAVIIALIMLGVVLNVFDWILMLLPNIELVTPLLIIYTYKFGAKALISAYVYAFIEIATHGFNVWNIMYLYVWAILVLIVWPLTKIKNKKVAVSERRESSSTPNTRMAASRKYRMGRSGSITRRRMRRTGDTV